MATIGQTTATGGRSLLLYNDQAGVFQGALPVNATINHVGIWCAEQTAANANDLKALIYNSTGTTLLYQSNVLAGAVTSTNLATPFDAHITFSAATLTAATYRFIVVSTVLNGGILLNGQNGPGGVPVTWQETDIYGSPPASMGGTLDSTATRTWDIYVDYTASGGGSTARAILTGSKLIRSALVKV